MCFHFKEFGPPFSDNSGKKKGKQLGLRCETYFHTALLFQLCIFEYVVTIIAKYLTKIASLHITVKKKNKMQRLSLDRSK